MYDRAERSGVVKIDMSCEQYNSLLGTIPKNYLFVSLVQLKIMQFSHALRNIAVLPIQSLITVSFLGSTTQGRTKLHPFLH